MAQQTTASGLDRESVAATSAAGPAASAAALADPATGGLGPTKKPATWRSRLGLVGKLVLTVGAFWLLLSHEITQPGGATVRILDTIVTQLAQLSWQAMLPLLLLAAAVKAVGIGCSMWRWHLLLQGQGIRFNFGHVVGSFLIGRFLGTFLPSTLGLDGYKLYDAARFSGGAVGPAAATVVEKMFGFTGIFLTFLFTLPLGYAVLGDAAPLVMAVTVPVALGVVLAVWLVVWRPGLVVWMLRLVPMWRWGERVRGLVARMGDAATAYRDRWGLLGAVLGLSFMVHFCTAAMYFFTALAVGAIGADFWQVSFASSIQIFATVLSPFTVAGEGVREIVQALLLTKHIGAGESVLSAALGFWAAEAMTLAGAVFWWMRPAGYRPRQVELGGASLQG